MFPTKNLTQVETMLYQANLVQVVPLAEIYDIKGRTAVQRMWQDAQEVRRQPDVQDPAQWYDKLHACMRGEFFAEALQGCETVLDVGCGEGWPALYLAQTIPHVTGIDLSSEHIALAQNTARILGLNNVEFRTLEIEDLPFEDEAFDGVSFGGNVFTYNRDAGQMLRSLQRVLKPGGIFAFEQWPVDPNSPPGERIQWFIDGSGPIVHYGAGEGLYWRNYFIFMKPETRQGQKLLELGARVAPTQDAELTEEQIEVCREVIRAIRGGDVSGVERVITEGENRSLAAEEFPALLEEAGFEDVRSWGLPDAVVFAQALQDAGRLAKLEQEDLIPYLRALVKSAPRNPGWVHTWVTCRKKHPAGEVAG